MNWKIFWNGFLHGLSMQNYPLLRAVYIGVIAPIVVAAILWWRE